MSAQPEVSSPSFLRFHYHHHHHNVITTIINILFLLPTRGTVKPCSPSSRDHIASGLWGSARTRACHRPPSVLVTYSNIPTSVGTSLGPPGETVASKPALLAGCGQSWVLLSPALPTDPPQIGAPEWWPREGRTSASRRL